MYYGWRLQDENGEFSEGRWCPVSLRVVPENRDPYDFVLPHALKGLRRYQTGRKRVFAVESAKWK